MSGISELIKALTQQALQTVLQLEITEVTGGAAADERMRPAVDIGPDTNEAVALISIVQLMRATVDRAVRGYCIVLRFWYTFGTNQYQPHLRLRGVQGGPERSA